MNSLSLAHKFRRSRSRLAGIVPGASGSRPPRSGPVSSVPAGSQDEMLPDSQSPVLRPFLFRVASGLCLALIAAFMLFFTGSTARAAAEIVIEQPVGTPLNGSVVAWGSNFYGQTNVPGGLSGVTAIAAGLYHTVALKGDGSVVAWGSNDYGQTTVPTGLSGVTAIAAGERHTVALKSNESVVAWGQSSHLVTNVPAGLSGVTAIAASDGHTVALKSDGSVVAWGDNSFGQTSVPAGLIGVTAIAAGAKRTVALKRDGSVFTWGENFAGQTTVPPGLTGETVIAAGTAHAVALTRPTVHFGPQAVATTSAAKTFTIKNTGDGPLTISSVSLTGGNASDFTVNTAGMLASVPATTGATTFTVTFTPSAPGARRTTLRVLNNDSDEGYFDIILSGALAPEIVVTGNAASIADGDTTPLPADQTDFGRVAAASGTVVRTFTVQNSGVAALTPGSVTVSGPHAEDFTVTRQPASPVPPGGSTTFQVTFDPGAPGLREATLSFTNNDADENPFNFSIQGTGATFPEIAIEQPAGTPLNGSVVAWGRNDYGQITLPADLSGVTAIAAGGNHTVALKGDGSVVAWGWNDSGQATVPAGLSGVTAIAAGAQHTVALKSDGSVVAWGWNDAGQTTVPVGLSGVTAIAAGFSHTVALKSDGGVVAWGSNFYGETNVPGGLAGVTAIATSDFHTVALKSDGSVIAWGYNDHGQTSVPADLSGVTAVAAGYLHTVAVKSNGSVVAWGDNSSGQTSVPAGLSGVTAIAARAYHTMALKSDGSVVAWGSNGNGQTSVPSGLSGVTAIAAGGAHTVALRNDGSVVAWGYNLYGQTSVPGSLSGVTAIAAGWNHTVALTPTVAFGAQPVATTSAAKTFTIKNTGHGPLTISSVSVNGGNASDFTVNTAGMLASVPATNGTTTFTVTFTPSAPGARRTTLRVLNNDSDEGNFDIVLTGAVVPEIAVTGNAVSIADGDTTPDLADHTDFGSVAAASGTVVRTFTVQNTGAADLTTGGVTVSGPHAADFTVTLQPASLITPGGSHFFRVTFDPGAPGLREVTLSFTSNDADENPFNFSLQGTGAVFPEIVIEQSAGVALSGEVVAWGYNGFGQGTVPIGLTWVTAIAAGGNHTVVLKSDYSVVAWGDNSNGQTTVPGGLRVTAIAAGERHTVALKSNGSVFAWGWNGAGQTTVPIGLTGVTAIAAGAQHTVALKNDGSVVAWGSNFYGQTTVPVGLTGVAAIAAGGNHTVALKSNGTVVAWGQNSSGQRNVPAGLTGVTAIAAGGQHTVALKSDGSMVAWGSNSSGQRNVPAGLTGVVAIAAGGAHTVALKGDGSVVARGSNFYGQTTAPGGMNRVMAIATGGNHTVALTPAASFGAQPVATTSAAKTFTIKNTGDGPLTISSVIVTGGDASDFTLNTAGMLTSVPATTGVTTFTVTFTPSVASARQTTLRVLSNDSDEATFDILLTGTGANFITLESWRQFHFGISANAGNAADSSDADRDGLVNLVEYAFGLDPTVASTAGLPEAQMGGGNCVYAFTRPNGVSGITYRAETSTDLANWTPIPDTGTSGQHVFSMPAETGTRTFARLCVSRP